MSNEILRAAAMFECENAMARHCYHHARGTHRDELEEIWYSDPSRHHWKMMKSVMKSYVEGQENAAKAGYYRRMRTHPEAAIRCHDYRYLEEISVHVLSTPVIKASADGTAVRAFYYVYANPGDIGNEILKGDCAVCMGMYDELVTRNRDGGFQYVPMADLVKQEGDIIHTGSVAYQDGDISVGNVQVITTQCEDLDLVLSLYNFSFSEEGARIASYGVEGETFEYVDGKPQLTDLVLNNPDISIRHSTGVYLTTIASVIDQSRTAVTVTDEQIEAYNTWLSNTDDAYVLDARVLALTTEEADAINRVAGDILTRLEEANIQFITGALNTEGDYDAFVEELNAMGIQDMLDAYQAAYDRYLSR